MRSHKRRRRWFRLRFSIATALIAVTVACMLLASLAHHLRVQEKRLALIREIENAGGFVVFADHAFDNVDWTTAVIRRIFGSNLGRPVRSVDRGEYRLHQDPERIATWIADNMDQFIAIPQDEWEVLDTFGAEFEHLRTDDDLIWLASQFPEIKDLSLWGWVLTDRGLRALSRFQDLESLSLYGTHVSDGWLSHLARLENLKSVELWQTSVTDQGMHYLARLHSLESLVITAVSRPGNYDMEANSIGGEGVAALATLPSLVSLDLSGTRLDDEGLKALAHYPRLECLDLSDTEITDQGLAFVAQIPRLYRLRLKNTAVTNQGMRHVARLGSLKYLRIGTLRHTRDKPPSSVADIDDDGAAVLANLPDLYYLDLSGTRVTDQTLNALAIHPTLRLLNVSNTQITDEGLAHVARMPRLMGLFLATGSANSLPTRLSDAAVAELKKARPDLGIYDSGPK